MAVSPQMCQTAIDTKIAEAERIIDRRLTEESVRSSSIMNGVISIDYAPVEWRVFDALIPRYTAAGWTEVKRSSSGSTGYFYFKVDLTGTVTNAETVEMILPDRRKITI